jgi:hypothetical protein
VFPKALDKEAPDKEAQEKGAHEPASASLLKLREAGESAPFDNEAT